MEQITSKISVISVNEKFEFGRTALYKAVEDNDFSQVEKLLSQGADINARDNLNLTPLHFAAFQNVKQSHYKVAEVLLKNKADANAEDEYGMTPLYYLVMYGNVNIIQLFLNFKAQIKVMTKSKQTLLFPAVAHNKNVEVVKMLIKLGLKINHCTVTKSTPLHHAIKLNKTENNAMIVEELLKNKADTSAQDYDRLTPVDCLIRRGNHQMLKFFFDFKTTAKAMNKNKNKYLFFAVRFNENVEVIELLLDRGSKINHRSSDGKTPLHNVAFHDSDDEVKFKIAEILLKKGADVEARDNEGQTPLFSLVKNGNLEIVQLFISFNADINTIDKHGQNLLFTATQNKNLEVLQLLIDQGLNINHRNLLGSTPLHFGCKNQDRGLKIIKCLLKNGANMSAVDNRGCLPLMELFVVDRLQLYDEINQKYLKFILEHTDFSINHNDFNLLSRNHFIRQKKAWKLILEHFAKLKTLNIPINLPFLSTVSQRYSVMNYKHKEESIYAYFDACLEELLNAKSTKLPNSWISLFVLLVNDRKKLKNYAGNDELMNDFEKINCEKKFPIYGYSISENVKKGIKRRQLFDKSSITLSNCLPIFNPNHLIIRDILDCTLSKKDLLQLCS